MECTLDGAEVQGLYLFRLDKHKKGGCGEDQTDSETDLKRVEQPEVGRRGQGLSRTIS